MVAGKAPAVIFVVRHGARLDAADKEWHLTSPTPYDPPLTYGGWTQCRALGARIASILLAREAAHASEEALSDQSDGTTGRKPQTPKAKRKKHRVILHSSPFLRCTQTSIAIAAGMSQFHGAQNELRAHSRMEHTRSPPRSRTTNRRPSGLETIADDEHESALEPLQILPIKPFPKTKLRIDAFLGEWFSPEYYEHITHPPNSILMIAGAKAELLHRGETVDEGDTLAPPQTGFFPGGWGSPSAQPGTPEIEHKSKDRELQLPDLSRMTMSRSPTRDRATTLSSAVDTRRMEAPISRASIGGYTPPKPRYAILPQDPIPKGYTAHAREACVDVDYAWDSTRPPQNWGDGGEYGEEWSSMHKRFRSGISRMVNWYKLHRESPLQARGHIRALHPVSEEETDEDCEVDTVLILVTHGAGCNALIGALTDQPVLMDVAMASLTMAMRKEHTLNTQTSSDASHSPTRWSSEPKSLSHDYSVLITASVDHLRSGTNPLSIPILQNPALAFESLFASQPQRISTQPYVLQPRYKMNKSSMVTSSPIDRPQELPWSAGMRYGGVQRSASAAARSGGSGGGLWKVPASRRGSEQITTWGVSGASTKPDVFESPIEEAAVSQIDGSGSAPLEKIRSGTELEIAPPPPKQPAPSLWPPRDTGTLVTSSPGLWSARVNSSIPSGPPSNIPNEVCERSAATKRRWTVNENREEHHHQY